MYNNTAASAIIQYDVGESQTEAAVVRVMPCRPFILKEIVVLLVLK